MKKTHDVFGEIPKQLQRDAANDTAPVEAPQIIAEYHQGKRHCKVVCASMTDFENVYRDHFTDTIRAKWTFK